MTKPKNAEEITSEEVADDTYDTDESYTEENAEMSDVLPMKPDTVSTTGIPARTRKTSTYELWAPIIEELRTTSLGQSYGYHNVPGVSGIVQGLRKHYGINAASRNVITAKMAEKGTASTDDIGKGSLWIEYPAYTDTDGNLQPDETAVKDNMEDARN